MPDKRIAVGCPTPAPNTSAYVQDVVDSNHYSMGKWVARFETEFAAKWGYQHAVACNNGTSALHLALLALGIGEGDEVIVPATTFVATANVVKYCGATPVIGDVDKNTWNLNLDAVKALVSNKTKAIIFVHLFGNTVGIAELRMFCNQAGIYLVEDCAESIGAYATIPHGESIAAGKWGDIAAFSFYGNKTITTGEGGMVVTAKPELASKARFYRGQAQEPSLKFFHTEIGYNYRMTDLQGAVGVAQLEIVDELLEKRFAFDRHYRALLHGSVQFQQTDAKRLSGYWAFACLLPVGVNPVQVQARLEVAGIETRRIFYPLGALPMYIGTSPNTPVAVDLFNRGIWLPLHAELSLQDVKFICDTLIEILETVERGEEYYSERYA